MRAQGATAEVFLTAFKTLLLKEQDIFLSEVMKNKKLREDRNRHCYCRKSISHCFPPLGPRGGVNREAGPGYWQTAW